MTIDRITMTINNRWKTTTLRANDTLENHLLYDLIQKWKAEINIAS